MRMRARAAWVHEHTGAHVCAYSGVLFVIQQNRFCYQTVIIEPIFCEYTLYV